MSRFGKIRRYADRIAVIIDFYLAAVIVTTRQLIQRARTPYRWEHRLLLRSL